MVHALTALQEHKESILAMLEVFVNEPLLDWYRMARNFECETPTAADDHRPLTVSQAYAASKVHTARQKLQLTNPVCIPVLCLHGVYGGETCRGRACYVSACWGLVPSRHWNWRDAHHDNGRSALPCIPAVRMK